jgi:lon-related putative ATP-dependent protease
VPDDAAAPLPADRLYRRADVSALAFETTADLPPIDGLIGQRRASDALALGTRIGARGFNIFAIGSPGARMHRSIRELLEREASERPPPLDWVYVNNFAEPHRPIAIALPCGRAVQFHKAMRGLIDDLKAAIPAVFESDNYQRQRSAIEEATRGKSEAAFSALNEKAVAKGIVILRTPMGFAMAPARNGEVVPPDQFNAWPESERRAVQEAMKELETELEQTLRSIPRMEKERRDAVRKLDQETARFAIGQTIEDTKARFRDLPKVVAHLETIRADLIDNVYLFVNPQAVAADEAAKSMRVGSPFDRYEVNVLVSHAENCPAAPVVEEPHPTLSNLVGRIEHISEQGVLITNFRLIRAGALHRANGGAILLDARNLLMEPYSWQALKRALSQQAVEIEDIARFIGLTTTVSLEPDAIPLDAKVVLVGERMLYYLLATLDPEFAEHFKVLADFDDDIDRAPATEAMIARLIGSLAREERLKPFDRSAVARTVEQAARIADDAGKLTLAIEQIRDLVAEASFWATQAGQEVVTGEDVQRAIDQQITRAARIRERTKEMILRDIALIDTKGSHVGQINGLSVFLLGGQSFGRPTRITCRVRPGAGRIIDIEREVELGGPLHSKGVLILAGFLAGRFALDAPMSLSASLVFEQSYSGVDGDSASSAELYTLLSALAEAPLRQDLAVTGSVNQYGEVQAIGGVNEKIEGFFEICEARGLTGTQGVLIPEANVQHLMLRTEVVEACRAGRFAIYPVRTIDQGIQLLTGRSAGSKGPDGTWLEGSINLAVEERLREFAKARRAMAGERLAEPTDESEHGRAPGKSASHT